MMKLTVTDCTISYVSTLTFFISGKIEGMDYYAEFEYSKPNKNNPEKLKFSNAQIWSKLSKIERDTLALQIKRECFEHLMRYTNMATEDIRKCMNSQVKATQC